MDRSEQSSKTKSKSEMYQCKVCPYNTLRKPFLDKHMQQKHGFSKVKGDSSFGDKRPVQTEIVATNIKRKRIEKTQEPDGSEDVEFACEICDFKTKHDVLLNIHLETHESEEGIIEGEMYQCTQCDFKTVEVGALRTHESTHKKLELFKCPNCDYATRHKCNFRAHIKTHEYSDKLEKYACKFCEFSSYNKGTLYSHMSAKHKGCVKLFQCEKCPYATPHKAHFATHQHKHMDPADLPTYHCEICDFETHNEGTIRRHVNKHKEREERGEELIVKEIDGVTQLVWFCCDLCEFRSKDQRYVTLHKKVHARADEINRMGERVLFGKEKDDKSSLEKTQCVIKEENCD